MEARLRSWWQKIKQQPVSITIIIWIGALGIVLLVAFMGGYFFHWDWTGFGSYTPPTKDSNFQRGKTLWDWLQLLIIPLALAIIAIFFNRAERKNEQRITSDNQQEAALQAYLDKMSELLLHENLRESTEDKEVRKIARVRTLTVLRRIDGERKASVLLFLYESGLINKDRPIINLDHADLSKANLIVADLSEADLSKAHLFKADLNSANLHRANLLEVNFARANLFGANLRGANLHGATLLDAELRGADLHGADLSEADLSEADLTGGFGAAPNGDYRYDSVWRVTDLSEADLTKADLSEANLSGATLRGAILRDAILLDVDLSGADLQGVTGITIEQLEKEARSLKGATMPDGSLHD